MPERILSKRLKSLEGKVALITGSGAKRVGNVVAHILAEAGMNIALHYNRSKDEAIQTVEELKRTYSIEAKEFQADLIDEEQVKSLAENVRKAFNRIDVLVNTASGQFKKILLEKTTAKDLDSAYAINTRATFLCCKYVGEIMVKQEEGGNIINVADWAITRPYLDYSAYLVSKGAIPTLTITFAKELAKRNPKIRVNYISPGPVMLPADMPEEEKRESIEGTLLKTEGSPEDIAWTVLYYAVANFVTGDNSFVDGGRHIN